MSPTNARRYNRRANAQTGNRRKAKLSHSRPTRRVFRCDECGGELPTMVQSAVMISSIPETISNPLLKPAFVQGSAYRQGAKAIAKAVHPSNPKNARPYRLSCAFQRGIKRSVAA